MSQIERRGHVRLATGAVCLAVVSLTVRMEVQSAPVLVSHWMLNEGSGGTTTDSAANRSGTLRNGARWISGVTGAAVNMDGVDDYISLPALEVRGQAFTIAAWVRSTGFPTEVSQRFIAKANNLSEQGTYWMIGQTKANGENRLRFRLRTSNETTTLTATQGALPVNTWYHVAASYDGSRMRLYLNGDEVGSMPKSGWLSRGSGVPVDIGRSPDGSHYLRGAIDDVRIYSSALTEWEIASISKAPESAPPAPAPPATNQPPTVSLTSPAAGASFRPGTNIDVAATAADADGTVSRVQFYDGSTLIGSDTSRPYSVTWSSKTVGSHTLSAKATDNAGATTTSATRTITIRLTEGSPPPNQPPPNQPPSVSLTAPSPGAIFVAPASIPLSASASDSDGTITKVEFYNGTRLLHTDTSSPYSWTWSNVVAGSYSLKAVAYDNAAGMTSSSTRDITVKPANLPSTAVFNPSSNHATTVVRYVLEVFPAGANTRVANPVATYDLGKPSISNGEIRVDVSSTILGLSPGTYVATVTAFGNGGSAQSAPSPQFTR